MIQNKYKTAVNKILSSTVGCTELLVLNVPQDSNLWENLIRDDQVNIIFMAGDPYAWYGNTSFPHRKQIEYSEFIEYLVPETKDYYTALRRLNGYSNS